MRQCKAECGSTRCDLKKGHKKAHQNKSGTIKWDNHDTDVQGWKPLFQHTPRKGITDFYSTGEVPNDYKCSRCKTKGCKLWRQYNTMASVLKLMCGHCALKDQKKEGPIDDQGFRISEVGGGIKCDQIGWLVPAIPCENEDTYWGYSSVPQDGVSWWRSLPSMP
jgi:hypothetical protein